YRRRAVHAGEDTEIVARADLAVGAAVALEGRALLLRHERGGHVARREGVVALEGAVLGSHVAIVLVHPVAGGDRLAGEADDLAELDDRLALADGARRQLVAEGDALARLDAFAGRRVLLDALARHEDVVVRAETKNGGGFHGKHVLSDRWLERVSG